MADGKMEINIKAEIIDNISRYSKVKRRMQNMFLRNLSDKEIIEELEKEIEQYRNRIEQQNKIIDELYNKTIQSENETLDTIDDSIDEDIEEIITDTIYADGKVRKTITEYKYKSDKEAELKG